MKADFYRLMGYVRPYKGMVLLTLVLGVVVSACTGSVAYAIRPLLDQVLIAKDRPMLTWLPLAVLAVFAVKTSAAYVRSVTMQMLGLRTLADVRTDLFRAMLNLPVGRFTRTSSGELISRMINDVMMLQRALSTVVKDLIQNGVTVIVLTGVVIYQDPLLAVLALGVMPLAFYPLVRLSKKLRKRSVRGQEAVSSLTQVLTETIGGIRVVKAFGAEGRELRRFDQTNQGYRRAMVRVARLTEIFAPMMEMIGALGVVAIIAVGGARVVDGHTSPGALLSFIAACMMLYSPVRALSTTNAIMQQTLAAAARIFEVMDLPGEGASGGDRELAGVGKGITFERVGHVYEGEDGAAVSGISFTARVGDVIALVGPSGAGKTTLVNLIPRFLEPTSGVIRVDGVDIRDCAIPSLRRLIGIVGQEAVLFDDTVAGNIAYGAGDREVSREEIAAAAKKANADDFIRALPEGYDTPVGERGMLLSGGQRQRIAIARAILKDAPILILDEATSALDSESERHVQEALAGLMENRTTFVIAHRLATVRHATRILVLDGGRIVEHGTHDELLAAGGLYRKLHDLQFQPAPQGAG